MTAPIVLCVDGSDLATEALVAGLDLVGREGPFELVMAIDMPDPMMVTGTGFAGGVLSPEDYDRQVQAAVPEAKGVLDGVANTLGLTNVTTEVLQGDAGRAVCERAEAIGARGIVLGSRGRGGLKRAVLGSVSDYVVRNASCPVVVTSSPG
jgi:nucleotide-binding universal stress UspA family protein